MTKAWGVCAEEQFAALPHMDTLRQTKDYVNQFGMFSWFPTSYSKSPANSPTSGLSRGSLIRAVDNALERLGTDYIDLFWIHRFDYSTPIEETMCALHDLVKSGKIRYIGASSMWAYQFAQMQFVAEKNGWTKFVAMQGHYSLLYREEEREMIKFCRETGVALCPWGPLAQGMLARPYSVRGNTARSAVTAADPSNSRPEAQETIKRVEELAKKKGWTMSQVALAWTLKRVTSPIIGFSSVQRIEDALSARGKELTEEEEKYLEELYTPCEVEGHE